MISERLQQRIANLTGDSMAEISSDPKGALSNRDMQMGATMSGLSRAKGVLSNKDVAAVEQMLTDRVKPEAFSEKYLGLERANPSVPAILAAEGGMSPQDKETLESMLQRAQQSSMAPMAGQAQELAMQGEGEDTQLAHLRPGEVVLPPEFFEDAKFEKAVENKFKQAGIDPEQAVVGVGIASLNEMTGLEQFGFFKKIGKSLKKVVKKVAPIAAFIPGVGTALGGVLGGVAGKVGGALGLKGTVAKKVLGGIGGLKIPGISNIAKGAAGGFGSLKGLGSLSGMLKGGPFGGLTNQTTQTGQISEEEFAAMSPLEQQLYLTQSQNQQSGILKNLLGSQQNDGGLFGSGLGDMLKLGGIGALASGLGKLAYEDAKKQKGVPLTPLTTMSPTGRYNIEAEIARRMGQAAPNPVEFGLLPAGTLPELSGGKPRDMMYGGPVMAYAQGGAVKMQEGGEILDPNNLPDATKQKIENIYRKLYLSNPSEERNRRQPATNLLTKDENELLNQYVAGKLRRDAPALSKYMDLIGFDRIKDDAPFMQGAKMASTALGLAGSLPVARIRSRLNPELGIGSNPILEKVLADRKKMFGYAEGGIMAFAQGGAVQMQEGGEMDPSQFPRKDGDINGPGTETSDDIPAMLSDGEFVMTSRAVRGAGAYEVQANPNGIISLVPALEEDRERGMDNMYKMMDTFANRAEPS